MRVHIHQTRNQIFAFAVNNLRVFRDFYFLSDFRDDAVFYQDGLILQNTLFVHRNDVHVCKSHRLR
ncbi:MAG: hypothetical protein ACR2IA_04515 [Pyrinomonadaceae bacterium]